jgi:hypothetical protein
MPEKQAEQVFMRFNRKGARWEQVSFIWPVAIKALGASYDLRRIKSDGTEEVREKTPKPIARQKNAVPDFIAENPNVAFEEYWTENGDEQASPKLMARNAYMAALAIRR